MFQVEVDGEEWNYAFVDADGVLSWDDREILIRETVRMYRDRKHRKNVKGEEFEGEIIKGKYVQFAGIGGQGYNAMLETEKGKRNSSLLVLKTVDARLN